MNESYRAGSNSAELALMLTVASLSAAPAYADVDDAVTTAVESVKVRWHGEINCVVESHRRVSHQPPHPLLRSRCTPVDVGIDCRLLAKR